MHRHLRGSQVAAGLLLATACTYRPHITSFEVIDGQRGSAPSVSLQCPVTQAPAVSWSAYVARSDAFRLDDKKSPSAAEGRRTCVDPKALSDEQECLRAYNDAALKAALAQAGAGTPVRLGAQALDPHAILEVVLSEGTVVTLPASLGEALHADQAVYAPEASQAFGSGSGAWTVHAAPHQFFTRSGNEVYLVQAEPRVAEERRYQLCMCHCGPGTEQRSGGGLEVFVIPRGLTFAGIKTIPYVVGRLQLDTFREYPPCASCA